MVVVLIENWIIVVVVDVVIRVEFFFCVIFDFNEELKILWCIEYIEWLFLFYKFVVYLMYCCVFLGFGKYIMFFFLRSCSVCFGMVKEVFIIECNWYIVKRKREEKWEK